MVNFKIKLIRKYKLNFIDFILQHYFPVGSLSRGVNSNQVWGEGRVGGIRMPKILENKLRFPFTLFLHGFENSEGVGK